jgi:hypothetical protein
MRRTSRTITAMRMAPPPNREPKHRQNRRAKDGEIGHGAERRRRESQPSSHKNFRALSKHPGQRATNRVISRQMRNGEKCCIANPTRATTAMIQ